MRKIWKPYVVLNKENHITGIYYYKENALKNMTQDGQCGYYTIPTDILVPQGRIGKIKADLFYLVIEFTEQEICLRGLFKSRDRAISYCNYNDSYFAAPAYIKTDFYERS